MSPIRWPWHLIAGGAATAAQILADLKASREAFDRTTRALHEVHRELRGVREDMQPLLHLEERVTMLEEWRAIEATRYGIPPRAPNSLPEKPR